MTDELKQKLTERFEQLKESKGIKQSDAYDKVALYILLKAYLAGGEYGYELGIKDAERLAV